MANFINTDNELIHDKIKQTCKKHGITISKLCRLAGVNRMSVANWTKKNPETVKKLMALEKAIEKLENNQFLCIAETKCQNQCVSCKINSNN